MPTITPTPPKRRIPGPYAGQKRVCLEPGCPTRLNQWHEGPTCYAHTKPGDGPYALIDGKAVRVNLTAQGTRRMSKADILDLVLA